VEEIATEEPLARRRLDDFMTAFAPGFLLIDAF
jgi:hypothetical protein